MDKRLVLLIGVIAVFVGQTSAASTTTNRGKWMIDNATNPCIIFWADIYFDLNYTKNDGTQGVGHIALPSTANTDGSSCDTTIYVENTAIPSQVLQLNFGSPYYGWTARFAFTRDQKINLDSNEYSLFAVNITANYSADSGHFPNFQSPIYTYVMYVTIRDDGTNDMADALYGNLKYSFYCPSKQIFDIPTSQGSVGLPGKMSVSLLQMEAYKTGGSTFSQKQTCPQDQTADDKVPVIVGATLAGLTIFTLVVYLIYRSRLPPEVLHLTAPNSHFENLTFSPDKEDEETAAAAASAAEHGETSLAINGHH